MDSVYADKKALRKEIRAKIRAFDEIPEQSQLVWDRVVSLPAYQQAKTVGLFLSMPTNEIQTGFLVRHAIESSKTVYVPQVGANFEQADMELIKCPASDPNFVAAWPTNKWKIPEPPADYERVLAQPGDLDVLIVPGLCFDLAKDIVVYAFLAIFAVTAMIANKGLQKIMLQDMQPLVF